MNTKLKREADKLEKEFDCYFRRQKIRDGGYNLIITTSNDFEIIINLEFDPYDLDYELYPIYFWSSFNRVRLEGKTLSEIVRKINKLVLEEKIMEKRKFNENYKYYYRELMSNAPIDKFGVNIKVGRSKYFPLNSESLKAITDFYYNEVQGRIEESRKRKTSSRLRKSLTEKSIYTTKMLNQYLGTALWASTDDEGEPLDNNFSINDFSRSSVKEAEKDIKEFLSIADKKLGDDWDREWDEKTIGHCLWLSRNGHGAGFFDERRPFADELQNIARKMGEKYVFEIAGDLEIE